MKERKILRIPEIPTDKVLLLNISRCYNADEKKDPTYIRPDVYEMTRKFWRADKDHVQEADYIFGVANGIVVGVFTNAKWSYMEFRGYQRVGFEGDEMKDSPYLGLDFIPYLSTGTESYQICELLITSTIIQGNSKGLPFIMNPRIKRLSIPYT